MSSNNPKSHEGHLRRNKCCFVCYRHRNKLTCCLLFFPAFFQHSRICLPPSSYRHCRCCSCWAETSRCTSSSETQRFSSSSFSSLPSEPSHRKWSREFVGRTSDRTATWGPKQQRSFAQDNVSITLKTITVYLFLSSSRCGTCADWSYCRWWSIISQCFGSENHNSSLCPSLLLLSAPSHPGGPEANALHCCHSQVKNEVTVSVLFFVWNPQKLVFLFLWRSYIFTSHFSGQG